MLYIATRFMCWLTCKLRLRCLAGAETFLFTSSRLAMGPTQPLQWVTGSLSRGISRLENEWKPWEHNNDDYVSMIFVNNQLDAQLFFSHLFILMLYMFRATSAHHQESQLYQYDLWYMSLYVGDCMVRRLIWNSI